MPDRERELATIDDWVAEHGVTRLPARFLAKVAYALPEAEQVQRIAALKVERVSRTVLSRTFDA